MKLQLEDVVDCLQVMHPGHDFVFLFDQSSGHTSLRAGGLNAGQMNVKYGGKCQPMRLSVLSKECIGPFPSLLKPGDTQHMSFPSLDECDDTDGPYWMPKEEREAKKLDIIRLLFTSKPKSVAKIKRDQLNKELIKTAKQTTKKEALNLAVRNNIKIVDMEKNTRWRQ